MTAFSWTLRVHLGSEVRDVVVELPGPLPFRQALPALWTHLEVAVGTPFFLGARPVDPAAIIGMPPLLTWAELSVSPRPRTESDWAVDVLTGPSAGRSIDLTGTVVVGRDPAADLTINDPFLSRRHAAVRDTDPPEIRDLDSGNGVWQAADRIDRIGIDHDRLVVRLGRTLVALTRRTVATLHTTPDGRGGLVVNRPPVPSAAEPLSLPDPPAPLPPPRRRPIPIAAAVAGVLLGVTVALVTRMWLFLLLAVLGPVLMVVTAVADRLSGRRAGRRDRREHRRLTAIDTELVAAAVHQDRQQAWDRSRGTVELVRWAQGPAPGLWAHQPDAPGAWEVVVAAGQRPARVGRTTAPDVVDAPLTLDLSSAGVLGLAGVGTRAVLRAILVQLLVRHPPSSLQVVVISDAADLRCLVRVPHRSAGRELVVLDDAVCRRDDPGVRELLTAAARGRGPMVLTWADRADQLPVECGAVVTGDAELIHLELRTGGTAADGPARIIEGAPIGADAALLDRCTLALSRLVDPDAAAAALPQRVRRGDLTPWPTNLTSLEQLWSAPSTRAVLGAGPAGPVSLDLERDGPHLLLAGTTGSGKSELLRTLVVGLAVAAPPTRTSLLLIDYKGGATFTDLAALPHVVGTVTDLEPHLAERALISLRAELRRREGLLRDAGVVDLARWREVAELGSPALPSLVIVVDEFATLATDLPHFLTGLLDVAQRGRSLGVHLILATQRPAGVVSAAMKANISARLCLRVADPADSLDLVDVADGARLPVDRPGRGLWRAGRGQLSCFQTALVGTAPLTELSVHDVGTPAVDTGTGLSDLDQMVALTLAASQALPRPPSPWLPPLPTAVTARDHQDDRFALLDQPEQAAQPVAVLPQGSLLVLGPPGSGRGTALRRAVQLWIGRGATIHLVGRLASFSTLLAHPAVASTLDGNDPTLVARLIEVLHAQLGNADRAGPPQVLVLDGWEAITTPLDLQDFGTGSARLAELVGRGAADGIVVLAAAEPRAEHHRVAGQFSALIRLGVDGLGPGGGCWGKDRVQIIQPAAVTPVVLESDPTIRVRALPTVVRPDDPALSSDNGCAVMGLGGDGAGPIGPPLLTLAGGYLISGPRRSGVSTALTVLAESAVTLGLPVIRIGGPPLAGCRTIEVKVGIDELATALIAHEGPLLVTVDEPEDTGPLAALLQQYLAVAQPGQVLAVGCRLDRASRAHRGLLAEVAACRTGILLQASGAEGSVLDVPLPRSKQRPGPGRGHLIELGAVQPLQVRMLP